MVGEVIRAQPLRVPRFWSAHLAKDRNAAAASGPNYECRYSSNFNEKSSASPPLFPGIVDPQFGHGLADMMATSAQSYNAPNVMLMRNESPSADTLAAMLASCGAQGLQGPRSVGGLEEAVLGGGQNRPFYSMFDTSEETGDDDVADDCAHHVEKKRRLAVDQVRSLEKNFELENKLEPERKMQLARELGLQPRQVAVWFQNRRARWKTKQLERDYDIVKLDNEGLKLENEALKSDLASAVEEKETLKLELNDLKAELLRLKGGEHQPKMKPFDGQVFDAAKSLDVAAADLAAPRLSPRAEVAAKSDQESAAVDEQTHQLQQQKQQQDYQHLCTVPAPGHAVTTVSVSPNREQSPAKNKVPGTGGSTSSESNSSEIMNADSPHPIDSVLSPGVDQKSSFAQLPPSSAQPTGNNVDTSLVQFAEDLSGGRLVAPQPFQRIAVKTEDGVMFSSSTSLQEECRDYFYNLDESGVLSWWEWP